jgi:formyltetrahydrofolate hydrolase
MEAHLHTLSNLFDQLGLASSPAEIQAFIATHKHLNAAVALCEAPFWTESQAKFLRDQIKQDADWAGVVDKLDASLR